MRTEDHHPVTPAGLESALAADLSDALADVEHLVDSHVAAMVALGAESQATIASSRSTPMFTTWLKLKAARLGATGIAALATTGGLAHAGELPAPIQDAVSVAAAPAGITVPTAAEADEAEQVDAEMPAEAGEATPELPEGEAPADDGTVEPDVEAHGGATGTETETGTEPETDSERQHPANHGAEVSAVAHQKGDDHGRRVSEVASANGQAHRHGQDDQKAEKSKGPNDAKGPKDDGRKAGGRDASGAPAAEEAGPGRGHGARHDREQDSRAEGRGAGSGKDRPGKGRSSGKGK